MFQLQNGEWNTSFQPSKKRSCELQGPHLIISVHSCFGNLGPVSISEKTSNHKISRSLGAARFAFRIVQSLWNLTDTWAALLLMCLSNCKAIRTLQHSIARLRDFEISRWDVLSHLAELGHRQTPYWINRDNGYCDRDINWVFKGFIALPLTYLLSLASGRFGSRSNFRA